MGPFLALIWIVALFARRSAQQQDQLQDFCRRFGHQTTVIDSKLYIDGGLVNYNPFFQNPLNYTNNLLLYADLTVDNQGMPNAYENLTKPATAPSVSGGILWPDTVNKKFYLYGGEFNGGAPPVYRTWEYDALVSNWTQLTPDVSQSALRRASFGAGVAVEDRALGYYYGGWLSNASEAAWLGPPQALSTFLEYDMIKNTWTNTTGPDSVGRAEGIMVYIPASDSGMLVYLGGVQSSAPGNLTGQPMDEILLYDISSTKWYTQKATGKIPEMRRRFCGGVAWAPDHSSYNIYLYGGAGMPPSTTGFDDVYILSLPSFTWIEWFPTSPPGTTYPHHSLTCNVINGNQMLILGGTFPNATTCDSPNVYGFHNLDLSENNNHSAKWIAFNDSKKGYTVPPEIVDVVGGSAQGSATLKAPTGGYDNPDLSVYFTMVYTAAVRTPTRAIPSGNSPSPFQAHKGAIIGGAVGGAVLIIALATGAICFLGRQRKKRRVESRSELLAQQSPQELYAPTNPLAFGHHSPQPQYRQSPVQLPAERYQSPIEIGGHEIHSTSDPFGSATTEKSAYSYPHPSPLSNTASVPPSSQSPYAYPSSHSRHGSQPASPGAIPLQGAPPGNHTYYPPPEEFNTPTSASHQQFTTPTTPYSNRSQAYSHSPAAQQYYPPPR